MVSSGCVDEESAARGGAGSGRSSGSRHTSERGEGIHVLRVIGHAREIAVGVLIPLVLEELVADAHLDVTPSPEKMSSETFCAFQPKRVIVPSFLFLLGEPEIVRPETDTFARPRIPSACFVFELAAMLAAIVVPSMQ
jgi:hypothetical protein